MGEAVAHSRLVQAWKVGFKDNGIVTDGSFDRMKHLIAEAQSKKALAAVRDNAAAYLAAFDNELEWVEREIVGKMGALKPEALRVFQKYKPFFAEMRSMGAPGFPFLENGCCDGSKALEGYEEHLHRKDCMLDGRRDVYGPLQKPKRVLLDGTVSGGKAKAPKLRSKWVELPE
jgi:hypothetical protein